MKIFWYLGNKIQAAHDKMSKAMLEVDTRNFNSVKEWYKEGGDHNR
jgi:hypothetical protein